MAVPRSSLHFYYADLPRDLLQRHQVAAAAARAPLARFFPARRRLKVRLPKRPGAALPRPGLVHRAPPRARIEEHAVAVGEFHQGAPHTDAADILLLEGLDV